ncbi:replication initiator protein [Microviridae sp.]|nr:replication initiator protein [Microviridae sp.]
MCSATESRRENPMLCKSPIENQTGYFPCGQCTNCRINRRRQWTARILLESMYHPDSSFITLTYDEDNVPRNEYYSEILSKSDLRDFIKRLRSRYSYRNSRFRFFACGEYGEQTHRPHYHAVLFGVGLESEPVINDTWGLGFTQVAELTPERAAYICGYVLKKMTDETHPALYGRPEEFATMSINPGLGACALPWLAKTLTNKHNWDTIAEVGDVWNSIRIEGKIWPLGSYLRRKLRQRLGIPQNPADRAVWFDHVAPGGEILELPPLPENFSPWQDIADYNTPWKVAHGKKEIEIQLPEINQRADHKARKADRRKHLTDSV